MQKVLVTGATGNVGRAVVEYLQKGKQLQVVAGLRDIEKDKQQFNTFGNLQFTRFDFEDPATYSSALKGIDYLFLLRPPHLTSIEKVFRPLLQEAQKLGVLKVLFISVQGAENSSVIPHRKIELLMEKMGFQYVFLRPSYFMQNLTGTLKADVMDNCIRLPSADAPFLWVDADNVGEAAARLLERFKEFENQALDITGTELANFHEVAEVLSHQLDRKISYQPINPFHFLWMKYKAGMKPDFIIVMLILHFLPRFQEIPKLSDLYQQLTGKPTTSLSQFIDRERNAWT